MKPKNRKANLVAYQAWFDKYIAGKWGGWHRPGGEGVAKEHLRTFLHSEVEAVNRLKQLGFDGADSAKRQITLNGQMTNSVSGVCSYLVKHHKWTYVLPAETGGQRTALMINRRYGVPVPIPA